MIELDNESIPYKLFEKGCREENLYFERNYITINEQWLLMSSLNDKHLYGYNLITGKQYYKKYNDFYMLTFEFYYNKDGSPEIMFYDDNGAVVLWTNSVYSVTYIHNYDKDEYEVINDRYNCGKIYNGEGKCLGKIIYHDMDFLNKKLEDVLKSIVEQELLDEIIEDYID